MNRIGEDNLQLIDFSEEDDYLIDFPFRDSLEDFRLSVSFDNVNVNSQVKERSSRGQSESEEPRRPSFLRKSLAWDSAFFTSAGVLNPEELFMINKGFRKAESNQPSSGTQKLVRPHKVSSRNLALSESDGFGMNTLKGDLFETVKPEIYKLSKRSKVATNNSGLACRQPNSLSSMKNISSTQTVKSVGASKIENFSQVPKSKTKTRLSDHQVIKENMSGVIKFISSRQTSNTAVERSDNVKMENKTRKAGAAPDSTMSKRSRWGDLSGLPKSTSFTSPATEKNSKVHQSYESSSSASSFMHFSNSIRREFDQRNTKLTKSPSSVHFSLLSSCSSNTSSASFLDGMFSESLALTTMTDQNTTPASDFKSRNSAERKFSSQNATRSSIGTTPFSGGSKRKIKSSGLRMPSPKIGFFDEEPIFKGSMQDHFVGESPLSSENRLTRLHSSNLSPSVSSENCLKVRKIHSKEHDGRKVGASCSKLKQERQIPKEISRNRMTNLERNMQKDVCGSFDKEKENVCSFEDQVNGLSRHLEVIDLDQDLREVKAQQVHELLKRPATPEHTSPSTRTPLAEKVPRK